MAKRNSNTFVVALRDAEKRLVNKLKERETATRNLAALNQEIPALEQTIRALKNQLQPTVSAPPQPAPDAHEVEPGMGSISAILGENGQLAPDIETILPEFAKGDDWK